MMENKLKLILDDEEIISISADDQNEQTLLSKKLLKLESTLASPIILLKNNDYPFYDTFIQIMFLTLSH